MCRDMVAGGAAAAQGRRMGVASSPVVRWTIVAVRQRYFCADTEYPSQAV